MTTLQADTRDDPNEDWEATLSAKDGHPVFALVTILALFLVTALASNRIDTAKGVAYVLGATFGPALLLWGIAYVITIRHASLAWRFGTLGVVGLVTSLYFIGVMANANWAAKRDFGMIADTQIDAQGLVVLPPDADRGPASRVFIAHFTELNAALRDRQQLITTTGLGKIANPQEITRVPGLLRDCARFDRAIGQSDAILNRIITLSTTLPGKLERAGIEPMVRRELLDGMSAGISRTQPRLRAAAQRLNALFDEAGTICTILARRHWVTRGNAFAFTNTADLNAYDRHIVSFNGLVEEDQAVEAEMRRTNALNRARLAASMR